MQLSNVNMECEIVTGQSMMDPVKENFLLGDSDSSKVDPSPMKVKELNGPRIKVPSPQAQNKIAENFFVAGIEKNSFMNF